MKTYNKLILFLLAIGLFTSCKKFVDGYQKDPNGVDFTIVEHEFTATILENQFFQKGSGMRMAMMWLNQATGAARQYQVLDNWNNASGSDFNDAWDAAYLTITHADIVVKKSDDSGNLLLRGLGKLYKAWAGGQIASLWGDAPFSQINDYDHYPDPVYDTQADVFNQVQTLLDEAIADLSSGQGKIEPDRDIYFGGTASKWIKIAHGLKAKFYLHTKQYNEALTEAALGPSNVNDDLYAQYDSSEDTPFSKWNPTKQFLEQRSGDFDASEAYSNLVLFSSRNNTKTTDNRKAYNYSSNNLNSSSSGGKDGKFFGNMPMVTYGEMLLIQTEAELRISTDATGIANALTHYNTYRALLTSGEYSGGHGAGSFDPYVAADFNAGGMENLDNIDPVKAFFREIFEERYLFFIGDYEAYTDFARSFNDPMVPQYFRLHYDIHPNSPGYNQPLYSGQPLRFIYPQVEVDANANFPGMVDINVPLPIYQ